ncbi:hypothetical protein TSUD_55080 [Trifolium subterraneum]|uniref:DDT domain-containing protein n=1 Tax=Trifolium subterraneum TaxID=3900 RepID=A0A2Z6M5M5_TRISU|nr:hypothetical protein TSUD_55080 [Trifolium subterraneum]
MEIGSSSVQLNVNEVVNGQKLKVRAVRKRNYDHENGTTCHQCRQKRNVFCAACKNPGAGKPCILKFCHMCLKNRYGEIAQEVDLLIDWMCPKCRGICNCSICMKRRGQQPTGHLACKSKARGFNSVSEMLCKESSEGLELNNAADLPIKEHSLEKELVASLSEEPGEENSSAATNTLKDGHVTTKKVKREIKEEIPFPTGIDMKTILDMEFTQEDVGNVLQFLEFCRVFGKALDIKKEDAGAILRALRSGQNTLVVEFQSKLLNLISPDSEIESSPITTSNGNNSWLKVLEELIIASNHVLKEFPVDWLKKGNSGYDDLDFSRKLILLNVICDEALGTPKLRKYIDEQNGIFTEEKKAAKTKVAEAKEKERSLKQKLKDEKAKAIRDEDASEVDEKWFAYAPEQKEEVSKYISSRRQ